MTRMKLRIKATIWKYKESRNTQSEQQKEKRILKNEESVRRLWNFKHTDTHIMRVSEGEEREQEIKNLFLKRMTEGFPDLVKEIDVQVQEAQRVPNKMDAKRPTPWHIIIKIPKVKDKERLLKAVREGQLVTYKGVPIRLSADFSTET